jgi:pyruvate formate lyase activating enzyme
MKPKSSLTAGMSRREFLKAGLAGFCGLAAVGKLGCSPDKKVSVNGEELFLVTQKGGIDLMPGTWFSKLDQNKLRCDLCPHSCILSDGERSICRVRENHQGQGYTLAYGNPALVQEDPVERKPFFHVIPGSRALSISTVGCNLACDFCEVWDMALVHPEEIFTYDMPPGKVVEHALASGVRAISYAFGEPVIFYEYMLETASRAREVGLLNLIHTAGYINPEPLQALVGKIDAANIDLKSFDPAFYRQIVGGELQPVLDSLKFMRNAGIHLEITSIVIPTLNDDMDMVYEMCSWIVRELGPDVPVHFARFYPLYRLSALPRTPVTTLDRARKTALEAGLEYVYIAKITGHEGENTFCPGCGKLLIKRIGFVIDEFHVENSRCSYCDREIPGRWV